MIKQLNISNFRCYKNTSISFNGTSILVGKNNAGKSTMIEALKIISSVTRKYKTLRVTSSPYWVGTDELGVSPNVENMNISDRGIFYLYGEAPAIIEAVFNNGTSIKAYVGEELDIFAVIYDSDGCSIRNSKEAKKVDIPLIEVLPQISAVLDTEKVIKKNTVDSNRATRLASRNFRNQLYYYKEAFPQFKELVESTWENLYVYPVEASFCPDSPGQQLSFFIRVNSFYAEIAWMGHGLQMWLQTMWFISQCPSNAIVVLDEPDVYMHADLQRKLLRLIDPMFSQLIVATHSLEIIEEVTPDCIVPIDSSKPQIVPIESESSLLFVSKLLGSPFNIDLARLFIANKFIIWQGDDASRKILSSFQSVLYPKDLYPLINLPKAYIDDWSDFDKVSAVSELFSKNDMALEVFCLLNSGYHTLEEINEIKDIAIERNVNIHIFNKNEIENYAISEEAIFRYIKKNKKKGSITEEKVSNLIDSIIKNMKESLLIDSKNEIFRRGKPTSDIISGRDFFSILSSLTQVEYGISISARQVIPYFHLDEIPLEIKTIIDSIMV